MKLKAFGHGCTIILSAAVVILSTLSTAMATGALKCKAELVNISGTSSVERLMGITQDQFWQGVGKNIQRLLNSKRHARASKKRLCEFLGLSSNKLTKIIDGKQALKIGTAVKIARFFKVPVEAVIKPDFQGSLSSFDWPSVVSKKIFLDNFKTVNEVADRAYGQLFDGQKNSNTKYLAYAVKATQILGAKSATATDALDAFTFVLISKLRR